jgi:HEXXH motif-containing protein
LITTHSLSADAFQALADGAGDRAVVRQLREAQLSKHLMLLQFVAKSVVDAVPSSTATAAFLAGYRLLTDAQAADPGEVQKLLGLPHVGSWLHDCLDCLDRGATPDFGYLAAAAAATAVRLGMRFEIDVPVRDGRVPLPGLGCLEMAGPGEWLRLSSDGARLRGGHVDAACASLVPDDGSGSAVPYWRGTPLVRAVADGQIWEVLLETGDRWLDCFSLPMAAGLAEAEVSRWRQRIQTAWELLVQQHGWAAGSIAEGVLVIVPLASRSDRDSATSPTAFGAIAASLPPSSVSTAETLVHEFQHTKLCGLMDMLPLTDPCDARGYAPWREDPRPVGGILQGLYAFTGIVRFWEAQRRLKAEPDDVLRASVLYERWRLAVDRVASSLLDKGFLTPTGARLVAGLAERARCRESVPVPAEAAQIARDVALDNWLTWQIRHMAVDAAGVAALAAAYQDGKPLGDQSLPDSWVENDVRTIDTLLRSQLLNLRYQDPQRYRQLAATAIPGLGRTDALLIGGNAVNAVEAYRAELSDKPDPAAWIGLALAIHRLPSMRFPRVFNDHLPVLFELHAFLVDRGIQVDPLNLAAWFE